MSKLNEFITYLDNSVGKDIYLWGGQKTLITSEDQIRKYETSTTNANRAIKLYRKRLEEGISPIYADDCSGLGVAFLLPAGLIPSDRSAQGLKAYCELIDKSALRKGCFVFRTYKTGSKKGRAYHIGYVVDDELNVVEAKGRDDGVVKRTLNASGSGYWDTFGIPSFFVDEINGDISVPDNEPTISYTRLMKLTKPYMRGEDVRACQKALNDAGYSCGSIDGIFGSHTKKAVIAFQKARKNLKVDGIIGRNTYDALFNMSVAPIVNTIQLTRLLKKKSPYMRGEDIKAIQKKLGIKADGIFGSQTEAAVEEFQKKNGLKVDGIVGSKTWSKLFN